MPTSRRPPLSGSMTFSMMVRWYVQLLLEEEGLTQKQLAAALGRSPSSVSQLLGGQRRRDDLDIWRDIAAHFGRKLSTLINDAEETAVQTFRQQVRRRMARQKVEDDSQNLQLQTVTDISENPASDTTTTSSTPTPPLGALNDDDDTGGDFPSRALTSLLSARVERLLQAEGDFDAFFTRFERLVEDLQRAEAILAPFRPREPEAPQPTAPAHPARRRRGAGR